MGYTESKLCYMKSSCRALLHYLNLIFQVLQAETTLKKLY